MCLNCFNKYRYRRDNQKLYKSIRDSRIGNQNPGTTRFVGDLCQELACRLYEWEDLHRKNDNFTTSIDFYDHKTGLFHQVQGRYYNSNKLIWSFGPFGREWNKYYKSMVCFCISDDAKMIERIYKIPIKEIKKRKSMGIYRDNIYGWYEQYIWNKIKHERKYRPITD